MSERRDYLLGPGESRWQPPGDVPAPGPEFRSVVRGKDTEDRWSWIEYEFNDGAAPHIHDIEDENIYLIDGEITVHVGDKSYDLKPGSFVFMPSGVPHAITMRKGPARGMTVSAPGDPFHWGRDDALAIAASGREVTPEDRVAISEKYGIRQLPDMEIVPGKGLVPRQQG